MNFLAHAHRFLHDPYFAAGTCVPDWLGMVARKTRVRKDDATRLVGAADTDPISRAIAGGIVQHLNDDDRFHGTAAFVELSTQFSKEIANCPGGNTGMRSWLVGHVLVELLLDSAVAEQQPAALAEYYRVLTEIDAAKLQKTVNRLAMKPTENLQRFFQKFLDGRFLYDYLEDQPLLNRLNGIMRRVHLPELPAAMRDIIRTARPRVRERRQELLGDI